MYFYNVPQQAGRVNETKQKYQTLYQLLPRAIIVYMAILVHFPANKKSTRIGTSLAEDKGYCKRTDDREFNGCCCSNAYKLVA